MMWFGNKYKDKWKMTDSERQTQFYKEWLFFGVFMGVIVGCCYGIYYLYIYLFQ